MTFYALHWYYSDGSGSGVLPYALTNRDQKLIDILVEEGLAGQSKNIEIVELKGVNPLGAMRGSDLHELPDELCKVVQEERKRQQEV